MILVTGGAGFIGSVLVKELNARGREDIVIVDRLEDSPKWLNMRGLKFEEYVHADDLFSEGDNLCIESVTLPAKGHKRLLNKVDFIFHMGACSSTTEMDMDYLMRNNFGYSQALFAYAAQRNIPIVYASSAATYGGGEFGYSDDHSGVKQLKPLNPYGYSKQLFDEWVLKCDKKPDHWFGLKFFNVFGPNEYHKDDMRSLVHKAYGQIMESGEVKLFKSHRDDFEDGMQLRDFVYVKDLVRAMIEMMNPSSAKFSGIFNMGTGKARSFLDLVKATYSAMDREENITFIDMPERFRNQYQYYTQAQMDKFSKFLPNFKFMDLEQSVKDYVQNHIMKDEPHL